jgi:hypothetical protein
VQPLYAAVFTYRHDALRVPFLDTMNQFARLRD